MKLKSAGIKSTRKSTFLQSNFGIKRDFIYMTNICHTDKKQFRLSAWK